MRYSRILVAVAAATLLIATSFVASRAVPGAAAAQRLALSGEVPNLVSSGTAVPLARVAAHKQITIAVTLRMSHMAQLDRLLAQISRPGSPQYNHYLTQAQANRLFNPSVARQSRVESWLTSAGLRVTQTFANHLAVDATGPASTIERLLSVGLHWYRGPTGSGAGRFYAPNSSPFIPASLSGTVLGVLGLDSIPLHEATAPWTNGVRAGSPAYYPQDVADAYDVNALWAAGYNGTGQHIGITLWTPPPSDKTLAKWVGWTKASAPSRANHRLVVHLVNGGNKSKDDAEGGMDVEYSSGMAPGATIDFWLMKTSNSPYDYNAMNAAGTTSGATMDSIITDSWGGCEGTKAQQNSDEQMFAANSVTGHNYFFSAGDNGSYCADGLGSKDDPFPNYPASSPHVTSVGGTAFAHNVGGHGATPGIWPGEKTWAYNKKGDSGGNCDTSPCPEGSGGGYSRVYARPVWQTSAFNKSTQRGYPDISALGDPNTGVFTCDDLDCINPDQGYLSGGTSLASPLWAGIAADINQMLIAQTATNTTHATTGFIAPTLYSMSSAKQEFAGLHDIVSGSNGAYKAAVGWDAVSGLGSPDAYNLARDWLGQTLQYWQLKSNTVTGTTTITWETLRPVTGYNVFDGTAQVNPVGQPVTSTTADFKYVTAHVFVNPPTIQPAT